MSLDIYMTLFMADYTSVRLKQFIVEVALALDSSDTTETNVEKRWILWVAKVEVFEHARSCAVYCP